MTKQSDVESDVSTTNAEGARERISVFDTTLRDGEQAPGYSMDMDQKLVMARKLAALKVDVIEAGFAAASPGDFASVERIAGEIEGPVICSLARAGFEDIARAGRALKPAGRRRIHVFLATSPVHREFKLQLSKEEVLKQAIAAVGEARTWADEVEFSPEDAIRTEREFLFEVIAAVIEAGAHVVNIPDTVGYTTPAEIRDLFATISAQVPGARDVVLSTHCHDDLGMAVANSLAALEGGARQIECTVNGIGERAGNASLEEAVMALKVREERFGFVTGVDTTQIHDASLTLCALTGNAVPRNKAIVGRNAFAHEAGIHQHGVLANRATYEIMKPEDVGVPESSLVLGKHSGKHAVAARARDMGYELSDNQLKTVFVSFKALADQCKEVLDADLEGLIMGVAEAPREQWRVTGVHVNSGIGVDGVSVAVVDIEDGDREAMRDTATAPRAEDAVMQAVARATGVAMSLDALRIDVAHEQGRTRCTAHADVSINGRIVQCSGSASDMMAAVAEAFVASANRAARQPAGAAVRDVPPFPVRPRGEAQEAACHGTPFSV